MQPDVNASRMTAALNGLGIPMRLPFRTSGPSAERASHANAIGNKNGRAIATV